VNGETSERPEFRVGVKPLLKGERAMPREYECPSCHAAIPMDDVNVKKDLALCRACGQSTAFSLISGTAQRSEQSTPNLPRLANSGFGRYWNNARALIQFGSKFLQRVEKLKSHGGVFEGETVLHEGPANHFLHFEGRGGWLVLTAKRLAFRSHGMNLQNQPLDIPLCAIRSARATLTWGLIPNGLTVLKIDGGRERFVLSSRRVWESKIMGAIKAD
jgi:hypothetical protein